MFVLNTHSKKKITKLQLCPSAALGKGMSNPMCPPSPTCANTEPNDWALGKVPKTPRHAGQRRQCVPSPEEQRPV